MNTIESIIKTNQNDLVTNIIGPNSDKKNIDQVKLGVSRYSDFEYELHFEFDYFKYNMKVVKGGNGYLFKYNCNYWSEPIISGIKLPALKDPLVEFISNYNFDN